MRNVTLLGLLFLLTGCGAQLLDKHSPNAMHMERHYQRVITYDCSHNVISDKIDTVRSATEWVEIASDHPSRVVGSDFYNRTTKSYPKMFQGHYKFQVDYSSGYFNMNVRSGTNEIEYKFFECTRWERKAPNSIDTCIDTKIVEEGVLILNVSYTEKTLPGYIERTYCDKTTVN